MDGIRKKMTKFRGLISFEEACSRIASTPWRSAGTEKLSPEKAAGRVLSKDAAAVDNVPEWNRSLVDGYAVKVADCAAASETNPVPLGINGTVEAGGSSYQGYRPGYCTEIFTGGIVPREYDSVIMAEDVERTSTGINVFNPQRPWEHIERIGDDIMAGSTILPAYRVIRPWHVSALVSSGVAEVEVYRRIRIGILSTGNELFEGSEGHIPNTTQGIYLDYLNRPYLDTMPLGLAHDDAGEIRRKATEALENCDVLVITGGTSLGGKDEVPEAMEPLGNTVFAGSRIRPGRTLTLYESMGKPVFSVSGIPVPSLLSFDLYFEVFLSALMKFSSYRTPIGGTLADKLTNRPGYTGIYRVEIITTADGNRIRIIKAKGSGTLSSILNSNGTLTVPGNIEGYESGEKVVAKFYGDAT